LRWSLIKNFEIQYGSFKGSIKWGGETNYLTTGILQNCTESTIMVSYTQPEDKVSFYPRLIFLSIILQCFFLNFCKLLCFEYLKVGKSNTSFILMQISNRIEEIFQISDINTFTSSKKLNLGEKKTMWNLTT